MASTIKNWNISRWTEEADPSKGGSKLTSLTNPANIGKIKYLQVGAATPVSATSLVNGNAVTGVLFGIGHGTVAGAHDSSNPVTQGTGSPWWDPQHEAAGGLGGTVNNGFNQIGDPGETNYSLASSDFINGTQEKDGSAQKFVNALLDSAYVAYNSGVNQGSGLSSMTVSRGDMSLSSSAVTGISGIVNTYSRSYSVTFNYKQSGMLVSSPSAGDTVALPGITNDLYTEAGDGPF